MPAKKRKEPEALVDDDLLLEIRSRGVGLFRAIAANSPDHLMAAEMQVTLAAMRRAIVGDFLTLETLERKYRISEE